MKDFNKEDVYDSVQKRFYELKTGFDIPSNWDSAWVKALCDEIYELKKALSKHLSQSHGQANHYGD